MRLCLKKLLLLVLLLLQMLLLLRLLRLLLPLVVRLLRLLTILQRYAGLALGKALEGWVCSEGVVCSSTGKPSA